MNHLLAPLVCALLLSTTPAQGQASGLHDGELIYYSQGVPGLPTQAGILRIDPATGTTSLLFNLWSALSRQDAIAFDPFRERIVFYGQFPTFMDAPRLYLLDGFGNTSSLGNEDQGVICLAPASGGRLYFIHGTTGQIHYLDASDQQHVLMDPSGSQPFVGGGVTVDAMEYDAGTNALFVAIRRNSAWACPATSPNSQVVRLALSADGSQLVADPECVDVVVDPSLGNAPVGFSHGPDGQLLIFIFTNSTLTVPRMSLVDPLTLTVTPYAFTDYAQNGMTAGTWSTTLERAVFVDAFHNHLRSYGLGEVGAGTIITPSIPISGSGSAEGISMIQVTRGEGTVVKPYCTAKTSADGCVPSIRTTGVASASAASGFLIEALDVPAQRLGLFFYGVRGQAAIPFLGGTKCMRLSPVRTRHANSGGAGTCGGVLAIDFNAYLAGGGNPQVGVGSVVHGQFWFRDPAHPVGGVGLSNAVTFTVLP